LSYSFEYSQVFGLITLLIITIAVRVIFSSLTFFTISFSVVAGGYKKSTPVGVVYRPIWDDQKIIKGACVLQARIFFPSLVLWF
jgi:precorrin-4 methylase